jgi:hypothetical protein
LPNQCATDSRRDKFAFASAKIRWSALKSQILPILSEPAVLTRIHFPTNGLKLIETKLGATQRYELLALEDGAFDIELDYQLQSRKAGMETGFKVPTHSGW